MSNQRILAFDLSYANTGYCVIEDSKILEIGSFTLEGEHRGEKLTFLYKKASKLIVEWEPEIVAIEEVFFSKFTATSFKPLLQLQAIVMMLTHRLNRSQPQLYLASEVRATHDICPSKIKKEFVEYSKKNGYTKADSKAKNKRRYDEFKKAWMVKVVNGKYKNLKLQDSQHDIADALLLALHVEAVAI